ncbi:metallophosphoesterase family protein [Pseudomarimonas arenosa]|uniref:Metallophosphoesterase n=1 Tax=Pseudomarimonas arenosa TaxID=2774145 RepID=A0AAW3ZJA5_9GAMM|nr:metallophosphoesterase [Pseudomarimonas arenosa]MBD8525237.1 metallophosphoesterase [Pseudomarimonas arenosa]
MSVILHLSDTHFGTEQAWVQHALNELIATQSPDLLILSGDITQRATRAQFAAAHDWLDRQAVAHRLLLAGNHDIPLFALWQRLFSPYRRLRRGLQVTDLSPSHVQHPLHVLSVKTTRRYRHIDGEISPAQIDRVRRALLAADRDALKIVVTHQPLWVERSSDLHNCCRGAERALQAWCEAGADVFLSGHIHLPFVAELPDHPGCWVVNAGTALSSRVRDGVPNSCNLIRYPTSEGPRCCAVERWDCPSEFRQFRLVAQQQLQLRARETSS